MITETANDKNSGMPGVGGLVFLKGVGVSDVAEGLSRHRGSGGEAPASHLLLNPAYPPPSHPPRDWSNLRALPQLGKKLWLSGDLRGGELRPPPPSRHRLTVC